MQEIINKTISLENAEKIILNLNDDEIKQVMDHALSTADVYLLKLTKHILQNNISNFHPARFTYFIEFDAKKELYEKELEKISGKLNDNMAGFGFNEEKINIYLDKVGPITLIEEIEDLFISKMDLDLLTKIKDVLSDSDSDLLKKSVFLKKVTDRLTITPSKTKKLKK